MRALVLASLLALAACPGPSRTVAPPPDQPASLDDVEWIVGDDGKLRRVPRSGIRLLAHGIPARIPRLRAAGNAIVPVLGAEVIRALMETLEHR